MKRIIALILVLLVLPAPSWAADDFDFTHAGVYNSPRDLTLWPATARLTSVRFDPSGNFVLDFDRIDGPNRWPDFTPPGWDGALQYTIGLCLNRGGWQCAAVVEYWHGRSSDASASGGDDIAGKWFYDTRWGPLYHQGPAVGEQVGLFVCAGDCRNRLDAWPGALHERSDVRVVRWGSSQVFDAPAPPAPPPVVPLPDPNPTPIPSTTASDEHQQIRSDINMLLDSIAQLETKLTAIQAQQARDRADVLSLVNQLTTDVQNAKPGSTSNTIKNILLLLSAIGAGVSAAGIGK